MSQKALSSLVNQAIGFAHPSMGKHESLFLKGAQLLRSSFAFARKVRYLGNKKDAISFAMGTLASRNPTMQQIARFTFGSLSILWCIKDLHRLKSLLRQSRRIIAGKHYVTLKNDSFDLTKRRGISPSIVENLKWKKNLKQERIKAFYHTAKEIFKALGQLTWHLTDVYSAINDNVASEVFVYGRKLWNELADPDTTYLLRKLKKTDLLNDWMFQKTGLGHTTKILIEILQVPAKVEPLKKDVKKKIKKKVDVIDGKMQDIKHKLHKLQGIPEEYLCDDPFVVPVKIEQRLFTPPRIALHH